MILNSYTVLTLFLSLVSSALGIWGLWAVIQALRQSKHHTTGIERREKLCILASILIINQLVIRVFALINALIGLDSLVPLVPGAMCAFGVMRANPELSWVLVVVKLVALSALVTSITFARADRISRGFSLMTRRLIMGAVAFALALADSVIDTAYVLLDRGIAIVSCCTVFSDSAEFFAPRFPEILFGADSEWKVLTAFAVCALLQVSSGFLLIRKRPEKGIRGGRPTVFALALLGAASLPLGLLMVAEALSPIILGLPYHHCPVEVWTETLDGPLLFSALFVGASFPLSAGLLSLFSSKEQWDESVHRVSYEAIRWGAFGTTTFSLMCIVHFVVTRVF